jgi:hypothetical protein
LGIFCVLYWTILQLNFYVTCAGHYWFGFAEKQCSFLSRSGIGVTGATALSHAFDIVFLAAIIWYSILLVVGQAFPAILSEALRNLDSSNLKNKDKFFRSPLRLVLFGFAAAFLSFFVFTRESAMHTFGGPFERWPQLYVGTQIFSLTAGLWFIFEAFWISLLSLRRNGIEILSKE